MDLYQIKRFLRENDIGIGKLVAGIVYIVIAIIAMTNLGCDEERMFSAIVAILFYIVTGCVVLFCVIWYWDETF